MAAVTRYGQTVAIVGAGATGALVALQLLRRSDARGARTDIRLIDPAASTGRGLAYSTTDEGHLLNVPAGRMSALPDEPDHFLTWLDANHGVTEPGAFVPRAWYGEYLEQTLAAAVAASGCSYRRIHEEVVEVHDRGADYTVRLSGGSRFRASSVVLALGSVRSTQSWIPLELQASRRFVADPWEAESLIAATEGAGEVLLVGTGLTMVDVALSLAAPGRRLRAVSRTGLLPQAHVAQSAPVDTPELPDGSMTLAEVRALVVGQIRAAVEAGSSWRSGIDSLRPITNGLWQRLSPADQDEFLRTDMRAWEVARHRTAPEVGARISELLAAGRLQVGPGTVVGARDQAGGLQVTLDTGERLQVDAVVDCTGPAPVGIDAGMGGMLLANLAAEGLVSPHRLGLGLQVDSAGHPVADDGQVWTNITIVGPLRRGEVWETTAIPEIRQQAADAATEILARRPERRMAAAEDLYGLALSAAPEVADLFNESLGRILRVQSGAQAPLTEAVTRDPEFALGHAALAVLGFEFGEDIDVAHHLDRATRAAQRRGLDRERRFVAAYARRTEGDSTALLDYVADHPRDVLALSVVIPTIAFSGAYAVPEQAWQHLETAAPHFGDDWWFTGLLAFARQEQGRMAEAADLADHSLALEPRGGTAVHSRAHVYFETGEHDAGLRWLDPWIEAGGRDAVHRAHFSWHAALHELALDDTDAVVRRYHRQLAPPAVVGTRALVDSASLLWRCQLEQVPTPLPAAAPVLRAAGAELEAPQTPFAAMHAAVAWAAAGDTDGLAALRARCLADDRALMIGVIVDFIDGLHAYLVGDHSAAADTMLNVSARLRPVGGSDAQREVVLDTAIAALIQAGRGVEAASLIETRMNRRPRPRDLVLRARALAATGSGG